MKDDGARLAISINDRSFSITDTISGHIIHFDGKNFTGFNLVKDVAVTHITNLQEAFLSYEKHKLIFGVPAPLSTTSAVVIREDNHFSWTVSVGGKSAIIKDNTIYMQRGFDANTVLSKINRMYSEIILASKILTPRVDIVRRIPDAKILVWVHGGHSVVCFEESVHGNTMTNCLIDEKFYELVVVSSSDETKTVNLLTTDLQVILTLPLDDSITFFYKTDEHAFEES